VTPFGIHPTPAKPGESADPGASTTQEYTPIAYGVSTRRFLQSHLQSQPVISVIDVKRISEKKIRDFTQ
jgi:hypothetical protein